jgi:HTH-type transcriptional regulator/antitoxin HigA
MNVDLIKNEKDYRSALKKIEALWDAVPGTPEGDLLEILAILVENYEDKHHRISPPDPIEAIRFRMDQLGMKKADLGRYLGGRNRATEILQGKRNLTVKMMKTLHHELGIPAESLLAK